MVESSAAWQKVGEVWSRFLDALRFYDGYEQELTTLALYTVGIAAYALVVYAFYQALSRRDLYTFGMRRRGFWGLVWRAMLFLVVFPLVSFLFFLVLSSALFFLAKNQTVPEILLISMSVVVGVRATTYVSQGAAVDLAKLVPLSLLGVLLVDPGYATLAGAVERFRELPGSAPIVLRYLLVLVLLEGGLRLLHLGFTKVTGRTEVLELGPSDGGDVAREPGTSFVRVKEK